MEHTKQVNNSNDLLTESESKRLRTIMLQVEKRTKKKYQLEIRELNDRTRVIYSFEEHAPFTIKMHENKYKDLDGKYSTCEEIQKQINLLYNRSLIYSKLVFCPICKKKPTTEDSSLVQKFVCSHCGHPSFKTCCNEYESIWRGVAVCIKTSQIYKCNGFMSEARKLGDVIFQN